MPSNKAAEALRVQAQMLRLDFYESPIEKGWRNAFRYGHVRHPVQDFRVDSDFCEHVVRSFVYLRDRYGYYPPIAVEHKFDVELEALANLPPLMMDGEEVPLETILNRQGEISEGLTWGVISDVRHRMGEGLDVKTRYVPAAATLEQMGLLSYVSPSFFPEWTDPHSGVTLRNVLREFTHCGLPHQKNLETPVSDIYSLSCALSENGFTQTQTNDSEEENMEEIKELIAALANRLDALESAQAEMMDGGDDDVEMMDDDELEMAEAADLSEVETLRHEVAQLRAEMAEKEEIPAIVAELGCTAEHAADLAPIKLHGAPGAWAAITAIASARTVDNADDGEIERELRGVTHNGESSSTPIETVVANLAEEAAAGNVERADAARFIMNNAAKFGYKASDVANAIRPELIEPAYAVTRH